MKKIEKVWKNFLKTNPTSKDKNIVKNIVSEYYGSFDRGYRLGISYECFEFETFKDHDVALLTNILSCDPCELFEDVHEYIGEDYQKLHELFRVSSVKTTECKGLENPSRYVGKSGMQVFDVIDEFGLDFYEGNALKYLIRYKKKNGLEDLKKCRDYLDYMIAGYME